MNQDLLHKYFKGETSVDEEKRILNRAGKTKCDCLIMDRADF